MESNHPLYFYPPPSSYPAQPQAPFPSESDTQLQRWANWVKFVSIFLMASSGLNLLKDFVGLTLIPETDESGRGVIIETMVLHSLSLIVGFCGYRAGCNKTSQSAKFYIAMLIGLVVISSIMIVSIVNDTIYNGCEQARKNQKQGEEIVCNRDDIFGLALVIGGLVLLLYGCCCSPVIYCACKLKKFAYGVEESRQFRPNQNIQMVPPQAGFQYGSGYPGAVRQA